MLAKTVSTLRALLVQAAYPIGLPPTARELEYSQRLPITSHIFPGPDLTTVYLRPYLGERFIAGHGAQVTLTAQGFHLLDLIALDADCLAAYPALQAAGLLVGQIALNDSRPICSSFRHWAIQQHGQQSYGPFPYSWHLDQAAFHARQVGWTDIATHLAIYGHDLVEDVKGLPMVAMLLALRKSLLRAGHSLDPQLIVAAIQAVSAPPGLPNRKSRNQHICTQIAQFSDTYHNPLALVAKLADRLANSSPRPMQMYVREYPAFRQALEGLFPADLRIRAMWQMLDQQLGLKVPRPKGRGFSRNLHQHSNRHAGTTQCGY